MKVVSELSSSRTVCAKAYLRKNIFSEYALNQSLLAALPSPAAMDGSMPPPSSDYTLQCSLSLLIDCLQLLGTPGGKDAPQRVGPPVVRFKIDAPNHPLKIRSEGHAAAV